MSTKLKRPSAANIMIEYIPKTPRAIRSTFVAAVMVFLTGVSSFGQTQQNNPIAPPTVGGAAGIVTTVYDAWPSNYGGYRYARVQVHKTGGRAFAKDRHYQVVVSSYDYQGGAQVLSTVVPLSVEAGKTFGSAEVFSPNFRPEQNSNLYTTLHVERAGGNLRPDNRDLHTDSLDQFNSSASSPKILFVSSDFTEKSVSSINRDGNISWVSNPTGFDADTFPNVSGLRLLYSPDEDQSQGMYGMAMQTTTAVSVFDGDTVMQPQIDSFLRSQQIHAVHPAGLPSKWIGLSGIDLVVISLMDLTSASSSKYTASKIDVLRSYVEAGGFLVVYDRDHKPTDAQSLEQIEGIFSRASIAHKAVTGFDSPAHRHWHAPDVSVAHDSIVYSNMASLYNGTRNIPAWSAEDWPAILDTEQGRSRAIRYFLLHDHLAGTICFVPDDMTGWDTSRWSPLLNTARFRKPFISNRMGVNATKGEPVVDFSIPGVGRPPVRMFQLLISVFLFAIGPLCYTMLKRRNRMQLLFFIVPATSAAACAGLLLYAALADGFRLQGRARTYTMIDHQSDTAVSWSQHSFYCGIQPGHYRFNSDDAAFITKAEDNRRAMYARDDQELLVSGGDARARMPHQIAAVKTYTSEEKLSVTGMQDIPTVTNDFETALRGAFIKTENSLFHVGSLAPGETKSAEQINRPDARRVAGSLSSELSPPVQDEVYSLSDYRRRHYYYYGMRDSNDIDEFVRTGTGEKTIGLFDSGLVNSLLDSPNTYLAIFDEPLSSESDPGDNIKYRDRMHIVHGKW